MSVKHSNRKCRLKRFECPTYWEEIVEDVRSGEQAADRIGRLFKEYQPEEGEGISFCLEDEQGNLLRVGCSDDGWVIMSDARNGESAITIGNSLSTGHKAFLFPDWTEIERQYLIPQALAQMIIKTWVDTGTLADPVQWKPE